MKNTLLIFLSLLFSSGCVPKAFEYKYISLEDIKEIRVLSYGVSELPGLKSNDNMPIIYELVQDNYILIFEVDKRNYWPSILVGAKSLNGMNYKIEAVTVSSCGRFDSWGVEYNIDEVSALRYVWSPAFSNDCEVENNEDYPSQQLIGFMVKDELGRVIGEERFSFILVESGTYYERDAP